MKNARFMLVLLKQTLEIYGESKPKTPTNLRIQVFTKFYELNLMLKRMYAICCRLKNY
jgi:hypothetical protein